MIHCKITHFCYVVVFKYLADKYLQRLKQQSAEETEVVHTSSNKIGKEMDTFIQGWEFLDIA